RRADGLLIFTGIGLTRQPPSLTEGRELWQALCDLLHEPDARLHLLGRRRVIDCTDRFAHRYREPQELHQMIEPGAHGGPPLLGLPQPVGFANLMWTRRVLAEKIELILLADPVLGVEATPSARY